MESDYPFGYTPSRSDMMAEVAKKIASCTSCRLHATRISTVPGAGRCDSPRLVLIAEGPGRQEDEQGLPFVGAAGKLLDRCLQNVGVKRSECFISNIVKCRPPNNRAPENDEIAACSHFLDEQISILAPQRIVLFGNTALRHFFGKDVSIGILHGHVLEKGGIFYIPVYHPAAALRNPSYIKLIEKDLATALSAQEKSG